MSAALGLNLRPRKSRALQGCLTLPLQWLEGAFFLRFNVSTCVMDDRENALTSNAGTFLGVADTGSSFVLVSRCLRRDCPEYCAFWGCFDGQGMPSGFRDTVEVYVSGESLIQWRRGVNISFPESPQSSQMFSDLSFGVQGATKGAGGTGSGVLFGLVRERATDVRPSFLEQTPFVSLCFDLRQPSLETLTFSPTPLIGPDEDAIKLIDLRRLGAPVSFYAALATSVRVGGFELIAEVSGSGTDGAEPLYRPRRVLCIFDTGTTGVSITRGMYNNYWGTAKVVSREGGGTVSFQQARKLDVEFRTQGGKTVVIDNFCGVHPTYGAGLDLVTPVDEVPWAGLGTDAASNGYDFLQPLIPSPSRNRDQSLEFDDVAFLGLSFLVGRKLRIDGSAGRLAISSKREAA